MGLFGLFSPPNVDKMKAKGDIKGLIKALGYNKDTHVCQSACSALVEIGTAAVELLIIALEDKNSDVRLLAVKALSQIDDTRAIKPLIAILDDMDNNVRLEALRSLIQLVGKMKGDKDVKGLMEILGYKPQRGAEVLKQAAMALGEIRDPKSVKMLSSILNYKSHWSGEDERGVRACAARALGEIGDSSAVDKLVSVIHPDNPSAALAIGKIGDRRAVEPLLEILNSQTGYVGDDIFEAVAAALGDIGDSRAVESLSKKLDYQLRIYEYSRLAEVIIQSLGKIGGPQAIQVLTSTAHKLDEKYRRESQRISAAGPLPFEPRIPLREPVNKALEMARQK